MMLILWTGQSRCPYPGSVWQLDLHFYHRKLLAAQDPIRHFLVPLSHPMDIVLQPHFPFLFRMISWGLRLIS